MEIKLTPQESEEYFYNALCNGLGYTTSGYGLSLDYSDEDYENARRRLKVDRPDFFACFEDVLMEMLRMGYSLIMVDEEGDGDEDSNSTITLKDVHERVCNTPVRHLMDMINENDDAETADVIIQQVFFNDIIFG
jgi:hypothetical protein